MVKQKVLLLGASGSMGNAAFLELWNRKDATGQRKYDIILLQRPSAVNKKMFKPFETECGLQSIEGKGIVEGNGFKIVWGDATIYEDMLEAMKGVDWVLCPMAFISPEADRNPKQAKAVNTTAIEHIVKAIGAQPNGNEHIKFVYTGTVAATGDRLPPVHIGRIGDPFKPSVFDFYATTKIRGEWAVLESNIKHWASLRQTFIMIPNVMSLMDPIMFHQPINSYMENNTMRDAGRGLINCLDVSDDSPFWRRAYNMGGGPKTRIIFLDFMNIAFKMLGFDYRKVMERNWFALQNFHMQFYEDSHELNEFIHNWGDGMEEYTEMMKKGTPTALKVVAALCRTLPPFRWIVEKATYAKLKAMASRPDGSLGWLNNKNDMRVSAFFGSYERQKQIPDWDVDMPEMSHDAKFIRLNHGYDETKKKLDLSDLKGAAKFRGGDCLSTAWSGDMYETLHWKCAEGHEFDAKPYTVLKAGQWCLKCLAPPWKFQAIADKNPFFAQVWRNHEQDIVKFYPEDCYKDIEGLK